MREKPRFATDQWCWDYTRTRIEEQSGRDYDSWIGPQFAAATKLYRNVANKYGEGRVPDEGIQCPRCDGYNPFDAGDYICQNCRYGS